MVDKCSSASPDLSRHGTTPVKVNTSVPRTQSRGELAEVKTEYMQK